MAGWTLPIPLKPLKGSALWFVQKGESSVCFLNLYKKTSTTLLVHIGTNNAPLYTGTMLAARNALAYSVQRGVNPPVAGRGNLRVAPV